MNRFTTGIRYGSARLGDRAPQRAPKRPTPTGPLPPVTAGGWQPYANWNWATLPPLRPIDRALIDRWLTMKSAGRSDAAGSVFSDPSLDAHGRRPWVDLRPARNALQMFSRWVPCPLHVVGYQNIEGEMEFDREAAEQQILGALHGLTQRLKANMTPRILEHIERTYPDDNPALHGITWSRITRYGPPFYDWLELAGIRGRGTNPLLHIRRSYPVSVPRKFWVQLAMIDPLLREAATGPLRTRALLYLLSNGLRRNEVVTLKVEDVLLKRGELRVYGKASAHGTGGPRMRIVPMLPWTRTALDDWLASRAKSLQSPWLFPHPLDPQIHSTKDSVLRIMRVFMNKVLPNRIEYQQLSPHALRLWFVTRSYANHVPPHQIMQATGHSSLTSMQTYLVTHPDETKETYKTATKRQWF